MATQADIGKWSFSIDATEITEILSISSVGTSNSLIDVTSFSSDPGTLEYIAGLADGSEVSLECNRVPADPGQVAMIAGVRTQTTNAFILTYDASTTYTFQGVCMSEEVAPSHSEQNKVSFSIKITGAITEGSV